MKRWLIILFLVFSGAVQADEDSGFFIDLWPGAEVGLRLSDFSAGMSVRLATGYQLDRWGFFAVVGTQTFVQHSRNATANIDSRTFGGGATFRLAQWGRQVIEGIGFLEHGHAWYELHDSSYGFVGNGVRDFLKVTAGIRMFWTFGGHFRVFVGPTLSYSNLSFKYPANYGNDQTSPIYATLGVAGGIGFQF